MRTAALYASSRVFLLLALAVGLVGPIISAVSGYWLRDRDVIDGAVMTSTFGLVQESRSSFSPMESIGVVSLSLSTPCRNI